MIGVIAGPPHASVLAASQCSAAAILLLTLGWILQRRGGAGDPESPVSTQPGSDAAVDEELENLNTAQEVESSIVAETESDAVKVVESSGLILQRIRALLNREADSTLMAGLEIGTWAFAANTLTVIGFQNTAASRGAFLIRLSAILTPIIASLAGECCRNP